MNFLGFSDLIINKYKKQLISKDGRMKKYPNKSQ